jgi:hypothetical protein
MDARSFCVVVLFLRFMICLEKIAAHQCGSESAKKRMRIANRGTQWQLQRSRAVTRGELHQRARQVRKSQFLAGISWDCPFCWMALKTEHLNRKRFAPSEDSRISQCMIYHNE